MTTVAVQSIEQSFEALADMARGLLDEQDRQRWQLGEIFDTVHTYYKEESVIAFCQSVAVKPKTFYSYRQVYRFYPRDVWKQYPIARYSQWRDAMHRLEGTPQGLERALTLIARANDANMPMRQFYKELDAIAGKSSTRVENLFDKVVPITRKGDTATFPCDAELVAGVRYHVTIREATDV